MSLPNWQWFRTIDISGGAANDPDWSGEPDTYDLSDVEDLLIDVPLDLPSGRDDGLKQLSIYAICLTTAGARVDRSTFTYDLTPIEIARPDPSGDDMEVSHPVALVEGATSASLPDRKATLNLGPTIAQIVVRVSDMQNVPGTADELRFYWRPGA